MGKSKSERYSYDVLAGWIEEAIVQGKSVKELAKSIGYSHSVLYDVVRKYKIKTTGIKYGKYRVLRNYDWLLEQVLRGKTDQDIAKIVGCSTNRVWHARKDLDIPPVYHFRQQKYKDELPSKIINGIINHIPLGQLAYELRVKPRTLRLIAKSLGLDYPTYKSLTMEYKFESFEVNHGEEFRDDLSKGDTDLNLSKKYGFSTETICYFRKRMGFPQYWYIRRENKKRDEKKNLV